MFAINLPDGFSDLSIFYDVSVHIGVFCVSGGCVGPPNFHFVY